MSKPAVLLDALLDASDDGPFSSILATTFTFDAEFFVSTGVLPALAGELDRNRAAARERRHRVSADVVRDRLGNPFVGVLQGRPSASGPTPGWIDRQLWPTRRLGVMHAKCLLAVGSTRAHALVTSANLTSASWCSNMEVAASWSASLRPSSRAERQRAAAIAEVASGIARLARLAGAPSIERAARSAADTWSGGAAPMPRVVWSGAGTPGRPLDNIHEGDEVIAISPFWAADDASASQVLGALGRLAPAVTLVGRGVPGGSTLQIPGAVEAAAGTIRVELAIAQPPPGTQPANDAEYRPLHGKQIAVRTGERWRSYVGSANATAQGLALDGRSNVELGVIVECGPLFGSVPASSVRPADGPDDDNPDTAAGGEDDWARNYARASLDASNSLEVHVEPAPENAQLEVPIGGSVRPLRRRIQQRLQLNEIEGQALLRRPEVILTTPSERLAVPVVLAEELKRQVGGDANHGQFDLDTLLERLRANPIRRPPDDREDDERTETTATGRPVARPGPPRKPVHRAREAIEVISAAETRIGQFLATNPPPAHRLVELRLGGRGGIVDLARRAAETRDTPEGLTSIAAAFVVTEISRLLERLALTHANAAPALQDFAREIARLLNGLLRDVERRDPVAARRLRKLQAGR